MSNDNTILLVEDDTFLIDILVQKFKSDGYSVIHAGDGETALKKVHENNPDLIFLDIILPGMNGFEVLKKLKDDDTIGNIPVAFLSNLGQKEDIEKGKRLGAVDFIVKANHSLDEIVDKAGEILTSSPEGSTGDPNSDTSESTGTEAGSANQTTETSRSNQSAQTTSGQNSQPTKSKQAEQSATNQTASQTTDEPSQAGDSTDSAADAIPQAPSQE